MRILLKAAPELAAYVPVDICGEMIEQVAFEKITFKEPPYRFEAGTPAIVEAIGLGAALVGLGYAYRRFASGKP